MARAWNAREGPHRILYPCVALLMMTALLAVMPMGTATAAHLDTTFEIDGNRAVDGAPPATDWANHPTVRSFDDLCERLDGNGANQDDIIEPSTKLNGFDWPIVNQKATKKGDLCLVQTAWEIDSDGHLIFFLGWERSDTDGEVTIYVPLDDGDGVADPGDVLLRYDYDSSDKAISIFEHHRTSSGWGPGVAIADDELADADVSEDLLFAETAVDLTGLGLFGDDGCQAYYGSAVITETGQSEANATLKDYVGIDISFSNCGALEVVKTTSGGDGVFPFTSATVGDFDITTSAGTGSAFFDLLEPGTYDLAEVTPAGWTLERTTCDPEFEIGQNETVTCAFHNARDASITIEKAASTATQFGFTSTEGSFTLIGGETITFDGLDMGTYVFAEDVPDGWELTGIACGEYRGASVDGSEVTIKLGAGDDVTCTFTNKWLGSITVTKLVEGPDGTFPFVFDDEPFDLTTDKGSASKTFGPLAAGVYDITEDVPDGWELSEVLCDGTKGEVWSEINAGVQVDLPLETDLSCYFTDTKLDLPRVTVLKVTDPVETSEHFSFEMNEVTKVLHSGDSATWIVTPGAYELEEFVPAGWTMTDVSCTGLGVDEVPLAGGRDGVGFSVDWDDEVECTFTNVAHPTVTVIKDTAGFATTEMFPIELHDGDSLVDTAQLGSGGSQTWVVAPGTGYGLDELVPEGWELTDVTCTGVEVPRVGSPWDVAFGVEPGDDVECTFTNKPLPTITVEKEANASGTFGFVLADDGPYDTQSVATGGSYTWTVPVGSYELSEVLPLPARWSFTGLECTGATETADLGNATAGLFVGYGDDAVCTFTNRYTPPTVTTTVPTPVLDLQIEKTGVVPLDLVADDISPVEWTLVVSHDTDSAVGAFGATITDPAPAGMTFVGVTSADTTCAIADNAVTCGPFDLPLGATITVDIDATVGVGGTYENTGTVTVTGDIDPTNDTDSAEVLVPEILGIEILPETGMDAGPIAWIAGLLLLLGALLVRAVDARDDSTF